MTKPEIQAALGAFIKSTATSKAPISKSTHWSQDAHNAAIRYLLKSTLKLNDAQLANLRSIQHSLPSLTANASAIRQWLTSKDVALLIESDEQKDMADRYGV